MAKNNAVWAKMMTAVVWFAAVRGTTDRRMRVCRALPRQGERQGQVRQARLLCRQDVTLCLWFFYPFKV